MSDLRPYVLGSSRLCAAGGRGEHPCDDGRRTNEEHARRQDGEDGDTAPDPADKPMTHSRSRRPHRTNSQSVHTPTSRSPKSYILTSARRQYQCRPARNQRASRRGAIGASSWSWDHRRWNTTARCGDDEGERAREVCPSAGLPTRGAHRHDQDCLLASQPSRCYCSQG